MAPECFRRDIYGPLNIESEKRPNLSLQKSQFYFFLSWDDFAERYFEQLDIFMIMKNFICLHLYEYDKSLDN